MPNSTVTVMGDFSFASRVTWDAQNGLRKLQDSGPDQLIRDADNDNMVSDTTMIQAMNVTSFSAAMYLCITVDNTDEEMPVRIPETEQVHGGRQLQGERRQGPRSDGW